MPRLKAAMMLSLAMTFFVPAFAQSANQARPGMINYIEGQATLNGESLTPQAVGRAELAKGETLATTDGKVEVLLTPGVFLRLGDQSAVTMVSPDLTRTEVQLDRGSAEIEVDQIYQQNNLLVDQGAAQTALLKKGLYKFDITRGDMQVYEGEAAVSPSQTAKKWITVKSHHELVLNGQPGKAQSFDAKVAAQEDPLYAWSKLRADYLGQANQNLAETYAANEGYYPGWAWNPGLYAYTWLPGDGMFWSPFGFGFDSPYLWYGGGFGYPGYGVYRGGVYHGGGFHGRASGGFHGGGRGGRR